MSSSQFSNSSTFSFTIGQIVSATGAPQKNVEAFWPLILQELKDAGIDSLMTEIAVIATVCTEVGSFQPINEYGNEAYFQKMYEGRVDLGNVRKFDGARYHGRGFIQLTGRANYRTYGTLLNLPLEGEPDIALEATVAAKILVLYFKQRGIPRQAEEKDWQAVRRSVNGGLNGWDRFIRFVENLLSIAKV